MLVLQEQSDHQGPLDLLDSLVNQVKQDLRGYGEIVASQDIQGSREFKENRAYQDERAEREVWVWSD